MNETKEEKKQRRIGATIMGTLVIAFIATAVYSLVYVVISFIAYLFGQVGIEAGQVRTLILITGLFWAPAIAFLIAWIYLAPNRRFFFFTKEGYAVIITKGGQIVEVIIRWKGYYLDKNGKVRELKEGEKEPWYLFGGFCYGGFYPFKKIHLYKFEWTGVTYEGKTDHHPEEILYLIPLMPDVYYKKISDVEDIKGLPIEAELLFTIQIVNPAKSRFNIQNWLETVLNKSAGVAVRVMKKKSYQDWLSGKEKQGETMETAAPLEIGDEIMDRLREEKILNEEFEDKYGILVSKIQTQNFSPRADYREATTKKYIAEQEKKKTMIDANAKAYKDAKEAEGAAKAAEQKFAIYEKTQDRIKLRTLEVLEQLKGTKWILSLPQATQMFSDVLKKPTDKINPEEILALMPLLIEELRNKTEKNSKGKKDKDREEGSEEDQEEKD